MLKNPWFTLVLGLIVGLAAGYMLAEHQAVPPAKPSAANRAPQQGPPVGHPSTTGAGGNQARQRLLAQASELEKMLAQNPEDPRLMVGLGNLYFDAKQWPLARTWYERALAIDDSDPNVITDYAVALRNLKEFDAALGQLNRALEINPKQWQAAFNKVIVLHFDLHDHDGANVALDRLKALKAENPQIPDFSDLEMDVRQQGSHEH